MYKICYKIYVIIMESDIEFMDEYVNRNDEDVKNYKKTLKHEINKLILNEWTFLINDWQKVLNIYKHRTELKNVKFIREIKNEILEKLGFIPVFFFLTVLYTNKEYPGPYIEVEKGLLLLYQLVSGFTSKNIKKYMPHTTFYAVYKEFWITNYNNLDKFVNDSLHNMFSNIKIRILSAMIKNPKNFKNITMMLDGHDTSIEYDKPDISLQKKWSYKLKSAGIRTQVLIDINEMAINLSNSQLCGNSSDGGMFLNMKLYNKIKEQDIVALDGGYTLFIKQFETLCQNKSLKLNDNNFFYPIRKENGMKLNTQEEHYNKVFGSFRSLMENQFKDIHNKFKRFSNNNSILKTDEIKYINLQLKVVFLLKNIQTFSEKFNIITQEHHKLWINDDFNFPSDSRLVDIVYTNEMEQSEKLKEMDKLQKDLLNLHVEDINNDMIIDNEEDNNDNGNEDEENSSVDFPEYENPTKKRKKKSKSMKKKLNIYKIRDINKSDNIYEVEKIESHKIENKQYLFHVKWKNYDDNENTWVKEKDFEQKDIIYEYFKEKNILY